MDEDAAYPIALDISNRLRSDEDEAGAVDQATAITVRALRWVPTPGGSPYFAGAHGDRKGRLFVLDAVTLYLADVDYSQGAAQATVTVSTRALADGAVQLTQHGQELNRATGGLAFRREWEFKFTGRDPVTVTGRITEGGIGVPDTEDAGEQFAQRLAGAVGLRVA